MHDHTRKIIEDAARGAAGGLVATAAMSAVMLGARRAGLMHELPPERITEAALDTAGIERSEPVEHALATAAHLAFGAGCGVTYALASRGLPAAVPGPVAGVAFGAAVWLASYAGWVPALGIMPRPSRDEPGRPSAMIAAHLVFGGVLGWYVARRRARAAARVEEDAAA